MICSNCNAILPILPARITRVVCPHCNTLIFIKETEHKFTYPTEGVGTELTKELQRLGVTRDGCGHCHHHALVMNLWGPDECWRRRNEICSWLRKGYRESTLLERIRIVGFAGLRALQGELAINQDPYLSVLQRAIEASRGTTKP